MDLHLSGKVALVTGGSRGLGLATAKALAGEGCHLLVCARGLERLTEAAAEIAAAGHSDIRVETIAADVSTADGVTRVVERAGSAFGALDILINNVGFGKGGGLEDTPDDTWQEAIDQTLFSAVRMSRAAVPHLRGRGGVIVIVSSIYGREAGGRMTYNAVKAAELSLTKSMAQNLAKDDIRVVGVAPGSILFPGGSWHARQQADPAGIAEFVTRELPFGRFGEPHEVGDVIAFLASPRAAWVSGTTVVVDGCQSRMF